MGLAIAVGTLAEVLAEDPEFADEVRGDFRLINAVLREDGYPAHLEPESVPEVDSRAPLDSFPYSFLHSLRRVYAHRVERPNAIVPALEAGDSPADDPVIERVASPTHHLLWHSDAEGYYVPVDFPEVIDSDELSGGGFGSSHQLLRELIYVAPALDIQLDGETLSAAEAARIIQTIDAEGPRNVELMVWIALFEAARLSLQHRVAIEFC